MDYILECKICGENCDYIEWDDPNMGQDGSSCCGGPALIKAEVSDEK